MKTIIAGGRDFTDYEYLKQCLNQFDDITEIVCGLAKGADTMGEYYAIEYNIPIRFFPADWDMFGKSAGFRRNEQMAEYAEQLIAFWDGKSKGTKHMIELATGKNLNIRIFRYDNKSSQ